MTPDLEKLKTFYVLAQTKSYTLAAARLYRTQSAVSHAIRKLEESLGLKLVYRSGRATALTEEGTRLYRTCEQIFHSLDVTFDEISSQKDRPSGHMWIGATVEFGNSILMKHMQPFLSDYPEIKLDFNMSHNLIEYLMKDDLDIIIDCIDHPNPELIKTPLFREAYVIACSPGYHTSNPAHKVEDLHGLTLLSLDKSGVWWNRLVHSVNGFHHPDPASIIAVNHIRGMIVAARHHMGVILVPRYTILRELELGTLIELFPQIELLEDCFSIFQKKNKATLKRHQLLVNYLKTIKPEELGG